MSTFAIIYATAGLMLAFQAFYQEVNKLVRPAFDWTAVPTVGVMAFLWPFILAIQLWDIRNALIQYRLAAKGRNRNVTP